MIEPTDLEERVMRAIAQADERNGGAPYDYRITLSKHAKEHLHDEAKEVLYELERHGLLALEAQPPEGR